MLTLREQIEGFDIDGGPVAKGYADRLAQEQHWTPDYTQRVIAEYKRFIYLAMISEHMVTPSEVVDEAWHTHLVYTDSYWNRLCGQILPRPLHHHPGTGAKTDGAKFADLYQRTLALYRRTFGEEPPKDIWCKRVSTHTEPHWVISKRKVLRFLSLSAGLVGLGGAAMGCSLLAETTGNLNLFPVLILFAVVIVLVRLAMSSQRRKGSGECSSGGTGCSTSSYSSDTTNSNDGFGGGHAGHSGHSGGHDGGGHGGHGSADAPGEGGGGHDGGSADSGDSGGGDGGGGDGGGDGGGGCGGGGCGGGGCSS